MLMRNWFVFVFTWMVSSQGNMKTLDTSIEYISTIVYMKKEFKIVPVDDVNALDKSIPVFKKKFYKAAQPQVAGPTSLYRSVEQVPVETASSSNVEFIFWEITQNPSAKRIFELLQKDVQHFLPLILKNNELITYLLPALDMCIEKDVHLYDTIMKMDYSMIKPNDWARIIYKSLNTENSAAREDILKKKGSAFGRGLIQIFESKEYYKASPYMENEAIMKVIPDAMMDVIAERGLVDWIAKSPFAYQYMLKPYILQRVSLPYWWKAIIELTKARNEPAFKGVLSSPAFLQFIPNQILFTEFFKDVERDPRNFYILKMLHFISKQEHVIYRVAPDQWGMLCGVFSNFFKNLK